MNPYVIKFLALGFTLAQVFTRAPGEIKTHLDAKKDEAEITKFMRKACPHFDEAFASYLKLPKMKNGQTPKLSIADLAETLELPDNVKVPADDDNAPAPSVDEDEKMDEATTNAVLLQAPKLFGFYEFYCQSQSEGTPPGLKLDKVVDFYNRAMDNMPSLDKILNYKVSEMSTVLDGDGKPFADLYSGDNRRKFIPLEKIPAVVQDAFRVAEDANFYQHKGVDIKGIIRAIMDKKLHPGNKLEGGSTITQQVIKNLLLGSKTSMGRKLKEIVLAAQLEAKMGKAKIFELYLNYVFLGRASWGVEMASQSYFNEPISRLDLNLYKDPKDIALHRAEAIELATLVRGPTYYLNPAHPERMAQRRREILNSLQKYAGLPEDQKQPTIDAVVKPVEFVPPLSRAAFYFLDEMQREARSKANLPNLTSGAYTVKSTINPALQKSAEVTLEDALYKYERETGRTRKFEIEGSLVAALEKNKNSSWQDELPKFHSKYYDVQWPLATLLDDGTGSTVGLANGDVLSLDRESLRLAPNLKPYDVFRIKVVQPKRGEAQASIRIPPVVQGGVVVLEASTGRVLALTGGFSYGASAFNRVTQGERQPGSTLKPFIYLSAMQNAGLQPNTRILDEPWSLPPIYRGGNWWAPKDFDGHSHGEVTIRRAVEFSLNLPTARIMSSMAATPLQGLQKIGATLQSLGIYDKPLQFYPEILGARPARLIDMARAYATVANLGLKPDVHFIDRIESPTEEIYRANIVKTPVPDIDSATFYQIRSILEGTIERGTAVSLHNRVLKDGIKWDGHVGAKTGTSNNTRDAWFICFTNDIVVATWVGYDKYNKETHQSTLGAKYTGARLALPIGAQVMQDAMDSYYATHEVKRLQAPLEPRSITWVPSNPETGEFVGPDFPVKFYEAIRTNINQDTSNVIEDANRQLAARNGIRDGAPRGDDQDFDPGTQYSPDYQPGQHYQPGREDNEDRNPFNDSNNYNPLERLFGGPNGR